MSYAIGRLDPYPLTPATVAPVPAPATAAPATSPATVSAALVAGSRTRQAEIQIVTADGDRVTLSASFTRSYAAAQATVDGGRATAAAVTTSSRVQLSVEGSLSQDELEDIAKVLQLLRKASHRRMAHDPERLANRLSHAGLDTLGQIAASFTTTVTRQQAVQTAGAVTSPDPSVLQPVQRQPAAPDSIATVVES